MKAYVLNENLTPTELNTIRSAIELANYEVVYKTLFKIENIIPTSDVAVVGLPPSELDEKIIEEKTDACVKSNINVVGIWLEKKNTSLGAGGASNFPKSVEKYASSVVCTSSDDFKDVLSGKKVVWEDPMGTPRANSPIKRNKC